MKKIDDCLFIINDNLIKMRFEPVFDACNNLVGYEALSSVEFVKNNFQQINAEYFFKNISDHERLTCFEYQIEFAEKYGDYFVANDLFLSLNAGSSVLCFFSWEDLTINSNSLSKFLRIEVSENVVADKKFITTLERVNNFIPVWLDDFSLSTFSFDYILNGVFECIKVDKSMYWKLRASEVGLSYLFSLCELLYFNKKKVIIEGVESETDRENIQLCSSAAGQGWLWPSKEMNEIFTIANKKILPCKKKEIIVGVV